MQDYINLVLEYLNSSEWTYKVGTPQSTLPGKYSLRLVERYCLRKYTFDETIISAAKGLSQARQQQQQ